MVVKRVQIYVYTLKKNDLFECFKQENKRGDGNETGLKKGEGTEIETTVLP